ncbi:MAG: hypothetical protein LAT67_00635 [Balneolales bacterium]|nr:hypothetical protein [Balneolales bacterium]
MNEYKASQIKPEKLIITIVPKGMGSQVVDISRQNGCRGGTILPGSGTRPESFASLLGLAKNPEKDVVFSLVCYRDVENVLKAITETADLNNNEGIAFIVNIPTVAGIPSISATLDDSGQS